MGNEKFDGTLYRQNYISLLSAGEIDKDYFIESLNRLIKKFGLQALF